MQTSDSCPEATALQQLAAGLLVEDEANRLHDHLQSCPHCADRYERQFDGVMEVLQRLPAERAQDRAMADELCARARNLLGPNTDANQTTPTRGWRGEASPGSHSAPAIMPMPVRLGRYRIVDQLGVGAFGVVYRGHDDELRRAVAIKVPHRQPVGSAADAEAYLAEARALAALDHPGIVPVHDVGRTEDGLWYVVSKFVAGSDLNCRLAQGRLSVAAAAELVALCAEALHHAHQRGLTHRDIKPANILLDEQQRPVLADFGLALREAEYGTGPQHAGTPAYMSPEQACGEGHRVDGRSDIFSLGVVLYELLTGGRPFRGASSSAILEQVKSTDPPSPRHVDVALPRELDRICMKCLAKRAVARYSTALDLAEDLRHWLATESTASSVVAAPAPDAQEPRSAAPSSHRVVKIVPKGLRCFDAGDADFFLELLPGPRDREGLPDSLRFWKARVEETDADHTFPVGLLYGPSGCGKSSLVRAGLLPRLAEHVVPLYVQATANDTEARLLRRLHKQLPALLPIRGLADTLAAVRRGRGLEPGRKLLVVIDQFEQWLHARGDNDELVRALRQCDGAHVQAVVMVRADFWMAATQFMHDLELSLDADNSAAVSLFDCRHAGKVLIAFGQAFGVLTAGEPSAEQARFVEQAVAGLAEDGKVIPVRLALFGEMMKGRPWTPADLRDVGGAAGIGVTFLEESFNAPGAPPEQRLRQHAARAVLAALLPEQGIDITGQMRSQEELQERAGYAGRPADWERLVRLLDGELRLVTPIDPEGSDEAGAMPRGGRYYQLTHDYLVPPLRQWLTRRQRETRRGRAELCLAERGADWSAKPENRHLPSLGEWSRIRLLTDPRLWTPPQARMMRHAARYHAVRLGAALVLVVLIGWGAWEGIGSMRAAALTRALAVAETADVPKLLEEAGPYRRWLDPRLHDALAQARADQDRREQLHTSLALLSVDATQVDYLHGRLLDAEPRELAVIVRALAPHRDHLVQALWATAEAPARPEQRLRAAAALAAYDPGSGQWTKLSSLVVDDLVAVNPVFLGLWSDVLRPVSGQLLDSLATVYRDRRPERSAERSLATNLLADYAADQPERLAELLMDADERQFAVLYPKAQPRRARSIALLTAAVEQATTVADSDPQRGAQRRANAAVALLKLGQDEHVWPLLKHTPDPSLRSYLIHRFGPFAADPAALIAHLEAEQDVTIQRALLLSLGEFDDKQLPVPMRAPLTTKLQEVCRSAADPGLHAAAAWLLRTWNEAAWLAEAQADWARDAPGRAERLQRIRRQLAAPDASPQWFVNGQGQTMVAIPGPVEFLMGSPPTEVGRVESELHHKKRISRSFALGTTAVTVEQYRAFDKDYKPPALYARMPDLPAVGLSWYQAAAYCNWLSKQEDIPPEQWCYETDDKGEVTSLANGYLGRTGYRLPTEAEMEYATRAGALTSRYFGDAEELVPKYAWCLENAKVKTWPVASLKPNDLGLFDMYGNVNCWCQEGYWYYAVKSNLEDGEDKLTILSTQSRVLRGGSFTNPASALRSAFRLATGPVYRSVNNGVRPARTLPPERLGDDRAR